MALVSSGLIIAVACTPRGAVQLSGNSLKSWLSRAVRMASDQSFSGRRVVITGAGRGLGRALAIKIADHGAETALLGRDRAALQAVAETIRSRTGRDALIAACDLTHPDSIADACRTVLADNARVDVLVNNAATWLTGALADQPDAEIAAALAATVTGTILVTKGLLPALRSSPAADIVTVVSTAGWVRWDLGASAAFHAAKHGQSGFSDALRHELKGTGIRVTALYPPDFDDIDPLGPDWDNNERRKLSNREVVDTILFAIAAPRACVYPVILMDTLR
jgi:NAD(P)-dependent dehydrogenase (short-subunit alcohol dehydrogenase family)